MPDLVALDRVLGHSVGAAGPGDHKPNLCQSRRRRPWLWAAGRSFHSIAPHVALIECQKAIV